MKQIETLRGRFVSGRTIVVAGAVLILVVVALLIPIPFGGRAITAAGDLMHAPVFGCLTLGVLGLLERFRSLSSSTLRLIVRCAWVGGGLFAFGAAIEFAQRHLGRSATLHDAIANGLGILAAALIFFAWQTRQHRPELRWLPRTIWAAAGVLLAIAWWNPLTTLRDVVAVRIDFPLLASFESPAELGRFYFRECTGSLTRQDATDGSYAMEITYQPTEHPLATMIEFQPDWSKMKTLEMDVALDQSFSGEGVRFMIKVIDTMHQNHRHTFRREWLLRPGQPQHLRITREEIVNGPDTRQLNLAAIQWVDLLLLEPGETTKVRVDALRLRL